MLYNSPYEGNRKWNSKSAVLKLSRRGLGHSPASEIQFVCPKEEKAIANATGVNSEPIFDNPKFPKSLSRHRGN